MEQMGLGHFLHRFAPWTPFLTWRVPQSHRPCFWIQNAAGEIFCHWGAGAPPVFWLCAVLFVLVLQAEKSRTCERRMPSFSSWGTPLRRSDCDWQTIPRTHAPVLSGLPLPKAARGAACLCGSAGGAHFDSPGLPAGRYPQPGFDGRLRPQGSGPPPHICLSNPSPDLGLKLPRTKPNNCELLPVVVEDYRNQLD